jgi:hypothetical protein
VAFSLTSPLIETILVIGLGGLIMVTEQQIKELAFAIWQKEGCPEGKHLEHYFHAKQILEEQEAVRVGAHLASTAPSPLKVIFRVKKRKR